VTLSVVLITLNEEANLARTLESVRWADEIIVVDSGSTDRTVEIARGYGAKVFVEQWKGFAAQKNSAIDKATSDYILSLDADEEVTPELSARIRSELNERPAVAYKLSRRNMFLGRRLRHGGMYPDAKIRFFARGTARYGSRPVHEVMEMVAGGQARDVIIGDLVHHAYPTLAGYIEHMQRYSTLAAEVIVKERKQTWFWFDVWLRPVITFKWRYFFRLGFLDGREGFLFHLYHAMYVSWKYAKAWELTRKRSVAGD
jgi:glycosyltransferase involved in cell wall biosynthesis